MAAETRRLKRLPDEGQIAGVCAGLAEYFDLDVTLIRLAFVILTVITGGGFVLAYIILAVVMPSAKDADKTTKDLGHNVEVLAAEMRDSDRTDRVRNLFGAGLIILGIWLLLGQVFPGWWYLRWDYLWPIALIVLGLYIATRRKS